MFEYSESPPPLHHSPSPSDQSQFPSRDTTPVTPVSHPLPGKRPDKERSLPWFKKLINVGRSTTGLSLIDTRLEPDFDDNSFPQFGAPPPHIRMAGSASPPLNISARHTSTSPRGNQHSNLTSALQRGDSRENSYLDGMNMHAPQAVPQALHEPSSDFSRFENGARPISVKGKSNNSLRRESLAQSMGTGMSWGGISVGSWIRDEYVSNAAPHHELTLTHDSMMMSGTSPFAFQSPSNHSSSYLPKLEANFMKDFSCCGLTLPTLHDLLQHYEEAHAQRDPVSNDAVQPPMPDTRAALAATTANQVQQEAQQRQLQHQGRFGGSNQGNMHLQQQPTQRTGFSSTLQMIPDMDTVDDMEMDDVEETTPPPNLYTRNSATTSPQAQYAAMQQQPQIPQLNTTMMQGHQAYRQSAPTTPIAASRNSGFQTNSATLSANPMQQFQDLQQPYRQTPDSSAPGTPGELDESIMAGMDDMSMNNPLFSGMPDAFGNFGYGMNNDMIDLCIDEPAKRLFQSGRGNQPQGPIHQRLGSGQYGANSELAKTIRDRQVAAGLPDTNAPMMPHEEPKPFRCPVIGCEKAYKNQNGLKYHKSVSSLPQLCRCLLTRYSTVTTTKACTRTVMAHSLSSILTRKRHTLERKAWRRRSHTSVMYAKSGTRT